jgi:hypothetical protein
MPVPGAVIAKELLQDGELEVHVELRGKSVHRPARRWSQRPAARPRTVVLASSRRPLPGGDLPPPLLRCNDQPGMVRKGRWMYATVRGLPCSRRVMTTRRRAWLAWRLRRGLRRCRRLVLLDPAGWAPRRTDAPRRLRSGSVPGCRRRRQRRWRRCRRRRHRRRADRGRLFHEGLDWVSRALISALRPPVRRFTR